MTGDKKILNPEAELPWYRKAAKKIIRENKNFLLVLDELEISGFTSQELKKLYETDGFQTVLRQERLKYANEIAADPQLSKNTAIGMMLLAIQKLFEDGEWDKALEGVKKLSQLAGWQGTDGNVTVFADLKGKEIDELRKQIESRVSEGTNRKIVN